jgi:hypothetical protein
VGRLLGVLSLQALPRRLTLDFRDVFDKGFAFDDVTGDVQIAQGLANRNLLFGGSGLSNLGSLTSLQGSTLGLINGLNTAGINIFDNAANSKSLPLWVLWADTYRKNIVYPIDKSANQADFQRAYVADALVAYGRPAGSAQTDLGNFLGKEVSSVTGSADFETLTVTLPGSDGYTAMGRFALPGQPVTVQLLSPAPAGVFNYFFNTAIEGTTK